MQKQKGHASRNICRGRVAPSPYPKEHRLKRRVFWDKEKVWRTGSCRSDVEPSRVPLCFSGTYDHPRWETPRRIPKIYRSWSRSPFICVAATAAQITDRPRSFSQFTLDINFPSYKLQSFLCSIIEHTLWNNLSLSLSLVLTRMYNVCWSLFRYINIVQRVMYSKCKIYKM